MFFSSYHVREQNNNNEEITHTHLSLGSQLVKTVRSLLSLMLSQGMSSSSADKDMAFTLSSRLNTLKDKRKKIFLSPEL